MPLPHELFSIPERAIHRNVLLWDSTAIHKPGPAWLWPTDQEYKYQSHGFLPSTEQSADEAELLYCMCDEPDDTWRGWLLDLIQMAGYDSRFSWLATLSSSQDDLHLRKEGEPKMWEEDMRKR